MTSHLSKVPGTLIAWHSDEDVQSVKAVDGTERLYVDGRLIPLTDTHHHATQQVINYCSSGKRERCARRKFWAAL
jgi:hypothetical protein